MEKFFNKFILSFPLAIFFILWFAISFKCGILFYGIFSLGMYVHLTVTTLGNAFIGREFSEVGDVFWKLVFLTLSCICLAIFFCV